jgi:hypothetical protein
MLKRFQRANASTGSQGDALSHESMPQIWIDNSGQVLDEFSDVE